jgi:HlyD family secretion protein
MMEAKTSTETSAAAPSGRARAILIVAGLVIVVAIAVGLWLASRPPPDQIQGMVDAHEVNVATKTLARADRLLAEEGDRVRPGQLLATLSSEEITGSEQVAQGALQNAQALASMAQNGPRSQDIAAARAAWLAAESAANLAQVSSRRADGLFAEGVIAAQRRDEAHAARDSSARMAEAARQEYNKALAGTRSEEKAAAAAQVSIARAGLNTARSISNKETRLVAPIAGEISHKLVEPGEVVGPAIPAYQIVEIDRPWVSINVREDQYRGIRMGRELTGKIPALGIDGRFRAYFINPQGDFATWRATRASRGYDVRAFEVRLRPVRPIRGLRPGMSVLFPWPQ